MDTNSNDKMFHPFIHKRELLMKIILPSIVLYFCEDTYISAQIIYNISEISA